MENPEPQLPISMEKTKYRLVLIFLVLFSSTLLGSPFLSQKGGGKPKIA
jgi:hypothetical protein